MDFKRTSNSTDKLDEFIAGADSQKEQSTKKGKVSVGTKFSKELGIKIRKKYPTYTLAKFIELALTTPIPYIKDEVLVTIYDQAKWHNTSMSEFVRFKMGLIEAPQPNDAKEKEHQQNYIVFVSEAKKEKIRQIAESLEISILTYSDIKILATYELKDIFTFDELMQFKAEANNFDLDLEEYIAMRKKG